MPNQTGEALWREASYLEDAGKFELCVEKYEAAVREGSVEAMINLGNIYDDKIVPRQPQDAVRLYERAILLGSYVAAWNLAKHYENLGDERSAIKYMKDAANLGSVDAQDWLTSRSPSSQS